MVVSKDYPYLQVSVTVGSFSSPFRALLDTGFDGHVILPQALSSQLGRPDFLVKTRFADGGEKEFPAYRGAVEVVGLGLVYLARITLLGDECLLGQGTIKRLKVTFDPGNEILVEQ